MKPVAGEGRESATGLSVSAVVLARNRERILGVVLDRLEGSPLLEVLVVDNGSTDGTAEVARARGGNVRLIEAGENLGIAGRNLAAEQARGDLLLMLDDDSHPLPGAVELLVGAFEQQPRLGVAAGLVRDVDERGEASSERGAGTFDWFLGAGRTEDGADALEGYPAFVFAEGGCMLRKAAYVEAGGFFQPYFLACSELDLATRLIGLGWDVRYFPQATFDHLRVRAGREGPGPGALAYRIRNQVWYFWLRFPALLAARRIPAYLTFDLIEAAYRGVPSAWVKGVADAWRERELVRGQRRPLPREAIRRAELNRGRMHLRLLLEQARRRLAARSPDRRVDAGRARH
jgi:GT2 family glycosyltransferase